MATSALATAFVNIVPGTVELERYLKNELGDEAAKGARDAGQRMAGGMGEGLGSRLKGALAPALGMITATFGAYQVVDFLKGSITAASDLGESINAVNVSFGKNAQGIINLGKNAATALGLSKVEFNGIAVQFSSFAETIAGKGGDVVGVIDSLSKRGADFASVFNLSGGVNEALSLFQSGLAGETEPLRRYGIDLSAAAVKAYAMANGIGAGKKELTEAEKVQARYGLLLEATSKTQGDFANTSDGLANQQRILNSQWEDAKATLGESFTPVLSQFVGYINTSVVPAVKQFFQDFKDGKTPLNDVVNSVVNLLSFVRDNWSWISSLAAAVAGATVALNTMRIAVDLVKTAQIVYTSVTAGITGVINLWKIATGQATLAQLGLNAAMLLNPIGIVVAAIAALIAGLVWFFTQTDLGKEIWANFTKFLGEAWHNFTTFIGEAWNNVVKFFSDAWTNIQNAFKAALDFVVNLFMNWSLWGLVIKLVTYITQNWDKIGKFFSDTWNAIIKFFADAWNTITTGVSNGIMSIINFFGGLQQKVIDTLAGAGKWLFDIGKNLIQGLIDGAQSLLRNIGNFFLDVLPGWIKDPFKAALGIRSPSRVFKEYGVNIGEGLVLGLDAMQKPLQDAITDLGITAQDTFDTALGKVNDLVAQRNSGLKKLLSEGMSLANARKVVDKTFGGPLQTVIDAALGQATFTNTQGDSVTFGDLSNMTREFYQSQILPLLQSGYTQTSGQKVAAPNIPQPQPVDVQVGNTGSTQVVNYYAAPNQSLDAERQLRAAMVRAKLVLG